MANIQSSAVPVEQKHAGVIYIYDAQTGAPKEVWRCQHHHKDGDTEFPSYIEATRCADAKIESILAILKKGGTP